MSLRNLSQVHWTPIAAALKAAHWLAERSSTRVLDVGSGPGKFCIVGALSTAGSFIGVEQRPGLTETARRASTLLGASRAAFVQGNMLDLDWDFFDAFYLYNPFNENVYPDSQIDQSVIHSQENYDRCIRLTQWNLEKAKFGTRVVTFHGFGGVMPNSYQLIRQEFIAEGPLQFWIKLPNAQLKANLKKESTSRSLQ